MAPNKTPQQSPSPPPSDDLTDRTASDAALITDLTSSDLHRRLRAQHNLIIRDGSAVPALLDALEHDDAHVRTAAAHVLAVIAEPTTAGALARALDDDEAPVRWVAAEGLVALGNAGVKEALRALVDAETLSPQLKDAVRHILLKVHDDENVVEIARPLLLAMHEFEVDEVVLAEAHRALSALEKLTAAS